MTERKAYLKKVSQFLELEEELEITYDDVKDHMVELMVDLKIKTHEVLHPPMVFYFFKDGRYLMHLDTLHNSLWYSFNLISLPFKREYDYDELHIINLIKDVIEDIVIHTTPEYKKKIENVLKAKNLKLVVTSDQYLITVEDYFRNSGNIIPYVEI